MSLGIADYLLKDELTSLSLYKSIVYSSERVAAAVDLRLSEKRYNDLFDLSPLPMWVVDLKTLEFLDINAATVKNYGYSREEFLSMSLRDIREPGDIPQLEADIEEVNRAAGVRANNVVTHKIKDGTLISVEIQISFIQFKGRHATIVIARDVTDNVNNLKSIQLQNEKLKEIAWLQSHVVRAPLARLMGLV
ncbi:hypothetical protein CJD36_012255 [Flavipsychrobacter stenotrophus]|uniref:PAS domain-containing protein n=1 Tax=Flavipsychrobacter stenotrophus TaxID=2077091 RepID=A0A2S7SW31_9BACT|nr:PAS domain S-box protein [Flavipsychrobacter stenotrophus]PQJ10736.1 hypothetical protein CJD36_012255 [Flavipsychrobacter stenotrophus]